MIWLKVSLSLWAGMIGDLAVGRPRAQHSQPSSRDRREKKRSSPHERFPSYMYGTDRTAARVIHKRERDPPSSTRLFFPSMSVFTIIHRIWQREFIASVTSRSPSRPLGLLFVNYLFYSVELCISFTSIRSSSNPIRSRKKPDFFLYMYNRLCIYIYSEGDPAGSTGRQHPISGQEIWFARCSTLCSTVVVVVFDEELP